MDSGLKKHQEELEKLVARQDEEMEEHKKAIQTLKEKNVGFLE